MKLTMTADRMWSADVDNGTREDLFEWLGDELGYLETEVREIAVLDEGLIELTHLVPEDGGYRISVFDDELVWVTTKFTTKTPPPGLHLFEEARDAA